MTNFWAAVLEEIKARGMSQSDIAGRTGLDKGNLSRILNGHVSPTLETAEAIIQACGMQLVPVTNRDLRDLLEVRSRRNSENEVSGLERSLRNRARLARP